MISEPNINVDAIAETLLLLIAITCGMALLTHVSAHKKYIVVKIVSHINMAVRTQGFTVYGRGCSTDVETQM